MPVFSHFALLRGTTVNITIIFTVLLAFLVAQIAAVGGAYLTKNPVGIAGYAVMGFAVAFGVLSV